ncbi:unnamed protein product [Adineta ricciae]|uniref:Uncharacterized protein n=1 Tax=Adineta ricciae TaxID=249248 RepID=A0A815TS60_ADIRI|nr:unnamed protein product [Adineta ricciae]CAF1659463.1 unnamed protein product [Adineta ricciae]
MNSSNVASAEEILKQGQMEREDVNAHIEDVNAHIEDVNAHFEDVSQQVLRNDIWNALKADEIAEASLQVSAETVDSFAGDAQSHLFGQFLSIATNFASLPFAENLHRIPELVESIKGLLEDMMKEVREYSDMASEFRDLIQCFVQMVTQLKHNVNMMLPLLTSAKSQIGVLGDVMSTDSSIKMNDVDKKDLQLALNRLSTGIQDLLSLAKSTRAESQNLGGRIHNMTNSVQSKKNIVKERIKIVNFCLHNAAPAASILPSIVVGGLVAADSFGGIGALSVSGLAFPPITAIVGACVLGGAATGLAILLVKKFWRRHQLKALCYLTKIFEGLVELSSANRHFMGYMADTEEKANKVSQNIQDIQLCLESERQRRMNSDVCNIAINSTTAMIESLEQISKLDISKWSDTSRMISFSNQNVTMDAITN